MPTRRPVGLRGSQVPFSPWVVGDDGLEMKRALDGRCGEVYEPSRHWTMDGVPAACAARAPDDDEF